MIFPKFIYSVRATFAFYSNRDKFSSSLFSRRTAAMFESFNINLIGPGGTLFIRSPRV